MACRFSSRACNASSSRPKPRPARRGGLLGTAQRGSGTFTPRLEFGGQTRTGGGQVRLPLALFRDLHLQRLPEGLRADGRDTRSASRAARQSIKRLVDEQPRDPVPEVEQDRSDVSIDAQRRALHDVAVARGLVVVADAVESGKDDDRPAFQRLLHDIKQPARAGDHVLALDTSRVARRRTIALLFEQECQRRGVRVIYRNVPDADPVTEMLLKSILQAMDEWHSLTSRQKGVAGMAENVRQGWRASGKAPRGYRLEYQATGAIRDGQPVLKSRLVIDDETAGDAHARGADHG